MSLLDITPLVIMRPRITSTTIEKAQEIMHLYIPHPSHVLIHHRKGPRSALLGQIRSLLERTVALLWHPNAFLGHPIVHF